LSPAEGFPSANLQTTVKPDGTFQLEKVPADKYHFGFWFPATVYVKSVRTGDQDVLEKGLVLNPGQVTMEVTLSAKPGSVEGSVQDDKTAAPGSWVALVPDPARPGQIYLFKSATADQNGRFTIKGVAPGDYKLYAWRETQYELVREPELLKTFESKAVKVTVEENGNERVELTVLKWEDAQRR